MKKSILILVLLSFLNVPQVLARTQEASSTCSKLGSFRTSVGNYVTAHKELLLGLAAGATGASLFSSVNHNMPSGLTAQEVESRLGWSATKNATKIAFATLFSTIGFLLISTSANATSLDGMYAADPTLLLDLKPEDACKWIQMYPNTVGKSVAAATEILNHIEESKIETAATVKNMPLLEAKPDKTSFTKAAFLL